MAQWKGVAEGEGSRGPAMPSVPTEAVTGVEEENVRFLQGGIGKFG